MLNVWIGNLGKYNEGELVGDWLKLPVSKKELETFLKEKVGLQLTQEEVDKALAKDGVCYEEYMINDYETDLPIRLSEYENIYNLNLLAKIAENVSDMETINAYVDSQGEMTLEELANLMEQENDIAYYKFSNDNSFMSSEEKMGYEMAEVTGLIDTLQKMQIEDFFDFEGYGRSWENGDITILDDGYIDFGNCNVNLRQYTLEELEEKYEVSVFPLNCEQLRKEDVYAVLKGILYEFPVVKMNFFLPKWVEMLEMSHPIKENVVANAGKMLSEVTLIKDLMDYKMAPEGDYISNMMMQAVNLENGTADIRLDIADQYYYENISELTGTEVTGEYQLISMIKELSEKRKEYEKVADAVQSVEMKGYGVVSPKLSDIKMDDPVLIKHGNKFGVKIKAVAPSVHMIRANIETEIAPIVGSEEQANDLIHYIKEGQSTEDGVWGTSIFGKSIGELMEDGIRSKISMMDDESQMKLQDTMQKVVNDNNGGLVCIII